MTMFEPGDSIEAKREKLRKSLENAGASYDAYDRRIQQFQDVLDARSTGAALDLLVGIVHGQAVAARSANLDGMFLCALTEVITQIGRDALDRENPQRLPRQRAKR